MKKTETPEEQPAIQEEKPMDLSTAWLITDNTLEPQPERYSAPAEIKFKTDKEFTDLIAGNAGLLFGSNTLLINAVKTPLECYVLLDYNEEDRHLIHFIDIALSKENFWELFVRVSKLFTLLATSDYNSRVAGILGGLIDENKELTAEIIALIVREDEEEQVDINGYLRYILANFKPFIMLLSDGERLELADMAQTYPSNWGKFAVPIIMKKYSDDGTLFFAVSTHYSDIEWEYGKYAEAKEKSKDEKVKKSTEEDHLASTQPAVKEIYLKIKDDLLKEDPALTFNPKPYYVALRKDKNLAFFHIRKKLISLVVMVPEAEARKQIKKNEIKTLTPKVQQFWNGECCTIVIENLNGIDEVIALLKKLVKK